jgi:hypothetical protein
MPEGTDLITWSPRVGATGDDRYDIPAGEVISAGTTEYSDPPTLAEVNSGSGINQVIAEYQRRRAITNTMPVYGGDLSGFSYVSSDTKIQSATITDMRSNINALRQRELSSLYSPWYSETTGIITGALLSDLRKSLAIDRFMIPVNKADHLVSGTTLTCHVSKSGATYPPTGTPVLATGAYDYSNLVRMYVGQSYYINYYKYRSWLYFNIPSGAPSFGAGVLSIYAEIISHAYEDWTLKLYRSDTHLAAMDAGDWDSGFDNLEDSVVASTIPEDAYLEMDITAEVLSGGQDYTFSLRSNADEDNSPTPAYTQDGAFILVDKGDIGANPRIYCPMLKLYTA